MIKDSAPAAADYHKQMKYVQHILFNVYIMDVDSTQEIKLKYRMQNGCHFNSTMVPKISD